MHYQWGTGASQPSARARTHLTFPAGPGATEGASEPGFGIPYYDSIPGMAFSHRGYHPYNSQKTSIDRQHRIAATSTPHGFWDSTTLELCSALALAFYDGLRFSFITGSGRIQSSRKQQTHISTISAELATILSQHCFIKQAR